METPKMLESQADFARRCNVSRQRVAQWVATKKIGPDAVVTEGKTVKIDVEKAQAQLKNRLDPGQRTSPNGWDTKLALTPKKSAPPTPVDLDCLSNLSDADDIKAAALGLLLTRDIGCSMANLALVAGAPIEVAFALQNLATLGFVITFEDRLAELGVPTNGITYRPDCISDLDWPARAADLGLTFDRAACEAYAAERARIMEQH